MAITTDVTMIGLGAMGSALAQALIRAGYSTTVWNRTPGKAARFQKLGANHAESFLEGLLASPVTLICVDNYDVSTKLVCDKDVEGHLSGKILIQLSTGTPKEATELAGRITGLGGKYLDGAIMAFPEAIGSADAQFLFAGAKDTYEQCKPILGCLGGDLRYFGADVAAPAVIDLAFLSQELATYLGAVHGAHICESENIRVDTFASILPAGHPARDLMLGIHSNKYDDPEATIAVWNGALTRIRTQASDAGINSEVPDFISQLFERAISDGYGEEDIHALIKVLRKNNS